jgi:hypothetical protein
MPYQGTPRRWLYLLALAPLVAGVVASWATGFGGLNHTIQSMRRYLVPGEHAVALTRGPYTVFYERTSLIDGELVAGPERVAGLHCAVLDPDGQPLPIVTDGVAGSYQLEPYQGASLFAFDAERTGTYTLRCAVEGDSAPRVALALGSTLAPAVLKAVGLPFGGLMLSVIVFMLVFVLRCKADRPQVRTAPGAPIGLPPS